MPALSPLLSTLPNANMDWKLVNYQASISWGLTMASVDTLDLRKGLRIENGPWQGTAIAAIPALLPAKSPASIETYVRGSDLVTTHPATAERPTRVQVYWRRWHDLSESISAALELIVSVQTHLLDSDPTVVLETMALHGSHARTHADYAELISDERHLLVLPHPHDDTKFEMVQNSADGFSILRHKLFQNRLEKGVILRGRLLFVWSDDGLDADALQNCAERFRYSEPMLTA
jgi:hypothetical protein